MNLTNKEIRIKVAEAMGWKRHDKHENGFGAGQRMTTGWLRPDGVWVRKLPDYPADLNACAEFEAKLNKAEQDAYWCHIVNLCNEAAREQNKFELVGIFYQITATARQRCIAYLKTKGILP